MVVALSFAPLACRLDRVSDPVHAARVCLEAALISIGDELEGIQSVRSRISRGDSRLVRLFFLVCCFCFDSR